MSFRSWEIFFIENKERTDIIYAHIHHSSLDEEINCDERSHQRREVLSSEEQFLNGLRRELLRRRCFLISSW